MKAQLKIELLHKIIRKQTDKELSDVKYKENISFY